MYTLFQYISTFYQNLFIRFRKLLDGFPEIFGSGVTYCVRNSIIFYRTWFLTVIMSFIYFYNNFSYKLFSSFKRIQNMKLICYFDWLEAFWIPVVLLECNNTVIVNLILKQANVYLNFQNRKERVVKPITL